MTQWTVARQAPLSMGFSRPEYWSGWPCPAPEDLPDPGIKPTPLTSPALPLMPPGKPTVALPYGSSLPNQLTGQPYVRDITTLIIEEK